MPSKIAFNSIFATVLCALFMSLMLLGNVRAAPLDVEIEYMTSPEVQLRIAAGATTILIPTGGTEQNGAHMDLGKHNFIVRETARRIASELGDAMVAPVLAYVPEGPPGLKAGHMGYAGTISLPDDVFESVLEATALSFKTHGFRHIVFVGDSGGNQSAQSRLAKRLSEEWQDDGVLVQSASGYYANNGGDDLLKAAGLTSAQIGTHAGVRDTSELMFIAPQSVDLSKAKADAGATGDATLATTEFGRELVAGKVAAAVSEIRAAAQGAPGSNASQGGGVFSWLMSFVRG